MDEKLKYRMVGVLVVIGAIALVAPFLHHSSTPKWEKLARRMNFKLPDEPVDPKTTLDDSDEWLPPSGIASMTLDDMKEMAKREDTTKKDVIAAVNEQGIRPSHIEKMPLASLKAKKSLTVAEVKSHDAIKLVLHKKKIIKNSIVNKQHRKSMVRRYTIQLASFSNHTNAKKLKAKLAHLGYRSYIKQKKLKTGKMVSKVMVGHFSKRERVEKTLVSLQQTVQLTGILVNG